MVVGAINSAFFLRAAMTSGKYVGYGFKFSGERKFSRHVSAVATVFHYFAGRLIILFQLLYNASASWAPLFLAFSNISGCDLMPPRSKIFRTGISVTIS